MLLRAFPKIRPSAAALDALRAFARDERGVTMIEFGILAIPFFTIILAILQTAIMFLTSQVLDSALEDASRRIRTGQAQGYSLSDFRNVVCDATFNLMDCSQIQLKSEVLPDFSTGGSPPVVQSCDSATCTWTMTQSFDPGKRRNVMQVSAYYRYPLIVVLPYFNLKNQPDNYRLMSAVWVFRNEPF